MTAPEDLALMLEVTSVPDTNLVEFSATASDPDQLAPLVTARVEGYLDLRQQKLERDGDEALARVKGLQQGLNRARDEAIEAESRLLAAEEAVARWDLIVSSSEQSALEALEARAAELRGKLIAMEKRFLPMSRHLTALLFSGLSPYECAAPGAEHFARDFATVRSPWPPTRDYPWRPRSGIFLPTRIRFPFGPAATATRSRRS